MVHLDMTNRNIQEDLLDFSLSMITYMNRDVNTRVNVYECTMTARLRDIMIMNPIMFLRSKVGKIPTSFLMVCTKCCVFMVISKDKAELASYHSQ